MDNIVIKMSHINVIQLLKKSIGGEPYRFEYLDKLSVDKLEELRDVLIISYNDVIEARKFAADMIYNRRK